MLIEEISRIHLDRVTASDFSMTSQTGTSSHGLLSQISGECVMGPEYRLPGPPQGSLIMVTWAGKT